MADLKYVKIRGVPLIDSSGNVDGVDISQFKSDFDSHHKLSTLDIDGHKDWNNKDIINLAALKGAGLFHSPNPAQFLNSSSAAQSIYVKGLKATASYSGISDEVGRIEGLHGVFTNATINMVNANELSVRGSPIEPTRINNDILLLDGQILIDDETLVSRNGRPVTFIPTDEIPPGKYASAVSGPGSGNSSVHRFIENDASKALKVRPGSQIIIDGWIKTSSLNYSTIWFQFTTLKNDLSTKVAGTGATVTELLQPNVWTRINVKYNVPIDVHYIHDLFLNAISPAEDITIDVSGIRIYNQPSIPIDIEYKRATFDAVIIKDGGTVDGVDVSTHNHDGTAIGGANIPLSNILISSTNWNNCSIYGLNDLEAAGNIDANTITASSGTFSGNVIASSVRTPEVRSTSTVGIATDYGYVNIGPQNTDYCHFATDRSKFHFNKTISANANCDLIGFRNASFDGTLHSNESITTDSGSILAGSDTNDAYKVIGVRRFVSSTLSSTYLNTDGNRAYWTYQKGGASKAQIFMDQGGYTSILGDAGLNVRTLNNSSDARINASNIILNRADTHIQFQESGADKWHMESVGGIYKLVQTGVAERINVDPIAKVVVFRMDNGILSRNQAHTANAPVTCSKSIIDDKFSIEYNSTENSLDFVYI